MKSTLLTLTFCLLSLFPAHNLRADIVSDIYRHALTDYPHSLQLLQQLKQQGRLSVHELNLIEGDLHFNRSEFFLALNFYRRVVHAPEFADSIRLRKDLLTRIIPCYLAIGDTPNLQHFCEELKTLAVASNDIENEAMAHFFIGRKHHLVGEEREAYRCMYDAVKQIENSTLRHKDVLLFHYAMLLVEYLQEEAHNAEAEAMLNKAEAIAQRSVSTPSSALRITPQMWKDIYAHKAVLAHRRGETATASRYYALFKATGNNYQYEYKCIEPYLYDNHLYDDMIAFATARKEYLCRLNVTLNDNMTSVLHLLVKGYVGKQKYKEAMQSYDSLTSIKRSMIDSLKKYSMHELASVYNLKERELQHRNQVANERLIAIVTVATLLVFFSSYIGIKAHKFAQQTAHKNRAMTQLLDEYMANKKKMEQQYYTTPSASATDEAMDEMRSLFNKMAQAIVCEKLYLHPDLSRETLMKRFRIPKNKFSSLFTDYAGMTYSQYINVIRLEHVVEMLRLYPSYTIEAIAEESGMSVTSLYRLFSQKYGMSPAEYREAEIANKQQTQ